MHLSLLPYKRAARDPFGPALADEPNGRLTNIQLFERVRVAADRLARAGVGPGDVVAVKLPNRAELIIALFAAWRLRAAATPINPALTAAEVAYQLADSSAPVLICDDDSSAPVTVITLAELSEPSGPPEQAVDHSDDDLALLIYTSGTTGRPKGVELTHANIMAMAQSMVAWTKMDAEAHSLLILPCFTSTGSSSACCLPCWRAGMPQSQADSVRALSSRS